MYKREIRLVISGTYSTGKTTTATALSIATGIPLINALSAREILTEIYPGRRFQDMNATELMTLGLKRFEERIREETILYKENSSFISDCSVLNEWIYGTVRLKIGLNPGSGFIHRLSKAILGIPGKSFYRKYMDAYGQVAKMHSKMWYTDVVHLPVEFTMAPDGHRPVSEKYRTLSDLEIQEGFAAIGKQPELVTGSQEERLEKIIKHYDLPIVVPIKEAVAKAEEIIASNREAVSKRIIEQYKEPSLKEKVKFLTEF
ncbi:AAA family ATPase [uncultured Streptococcus sp.]|uniref:AAA family ATPase n=1 Tax=uncultured Streptococcus sp. TaxID=83427 RepID=UPI0026DC1EBB|nr:AAA family ATPase [uncultured Streptococcus sp.]